MSGSQSPPDYPDDMRDLFEDSEDENAENSGEQSGGLEQADTKRKLSEDEINPRSLNEGDQEDLVCFLVLISSFSTPDVEIESDSKEASSKLRN